MQSEAPVWTSAHLYQHGDLDRLLRDLVLPFVSRLDAAKQLHNFFFIRYWEGGPHLRVRLLTDRDQTNQVRTRLAEGLRDYASSHVPTSHMDQATYDDIAARSARLERRDTYEKSLHPAPGISFAVYQPERASFGSGPSLTAVENHFRISTAVAVDCLNLSVARRQSTAMVMALAAATCLPAGSLRTGLGPPPMVDTAGRLDFFDPVEAEDAWNHIGSELGAMAARLRSADHRTAPHGPVRTWWCSLSALRDQLTALQKDSLFPSRSPHAVAHALDRCLHLHLNRMGISPHQETRIRHLANRAADLPDRRSEASRPTEGTPGRLGSRATGHPPTRRDTR